MIKSCKGFFVILRIPRLNLNSYDYEDTRFNRIDRVIVIGTRDTVIDPKSNEDYWDGYGLVSLIFGGEHQIKDFSFLKYLNQLQ